MDFWEALAIGIIAFNLSIWTADMVMDLLGDQRFLKKPFVTELRTNLILSAGFSLLMYLILIIDNEWIGMPLFVAGAIGLFLGYTKLSASSQTGKPEDGEDRVIGMAFSAILFRPWFALTYAVFEYGF